MMYDLEMRKRIVITAIALVLGGVLAYVLSQPKKGSLEWHKKEYRNARIRLRGSSVFDRLRQVYAGMNAKPMSLERTGTELRARQTNVWFHETRLVELGFLGRRKVPVHGTQFPLVLGRLQSDEGIRAYASGRLSYPLGYEISNTGAVVEVTAPVADLPKWEELLRQDGAETSGK
jgi:hypothetical protein